LVAVAAGHLALLVQVVMLAPVVVAAVGHNHLLACLEYLPHFIQLVVVALEQQVKETAVQLVVKLGLIKQPTLLQA
jgi:hypothetical protein